MPKHALLAGLRPAEKFLFSVVILFILGLIFQFLGAVLAAWIYGFNISEVPSLGTYEDARFLAASKLIQILGSVWTFIVPAFLFSCQPPLLCHNYPTTIKLTPKNFHPSINIFSSMRNIY